MNRPAPRLFPRVLAERPPILGVYRSSPLGGTEVYCDDCGEHLDTLPEVAVAKEFSGHRDTIADFVKFHTGEKPERILGHRCDR